MFELEFSVPSPRFLNKIKNKKLNSSTLSFLYAIRLKKNRVLNLFWSVGLVGVGCVRVYVCLIVYLRARVRVRVRVRACFFLNACMDACVWLCVSFICYQYLPMKRRMLQTKPCRQIRSPTPAANEIYLRFHPWMIHDPSIPPCSSIQVDFEGYCFIETTTNEVSMSQGVDRRFVWYRWRITIQCVSTWSGSEAIPLIDRTSRQRQSLLRMVRDKRMFYCPIIW